MNSRTNLLVAGIVLALFVGLGGGYWFSQPDEPGSYLSGAGEGPDGHGLHTGVCK